MTEELWKTISHSPLYEISNRGRVKSNHPKSKGRLLTPYACKYRGVNRPARVVKMTVALGRKNVWSVHTLVLEAFVCPRPEGLEACHIDGDPTNNRVENLRWDTHYANMQDIKLHGTHYTPWNRRGEDHRNSKLTENDIREIRAHPVYQGSRVKLAARFGVSPVQISRIARGECWRHV